MCTHKQVGITVLFIDDNTGLKLNYFIKEKQANAKGMSLQRKEHDFMFLIYLPLGGV